MVASGSAGTDELMPLDSSRGIALFTDGSCSSKDRVGGWAWVAMDHVGNDMQGYGCAYDTTNNRMEITAWIDGLENLFLHYGCCYVNVYSDSKYVGLGAMDRHRTRNKNRDLWDYLDKCIDDHSHVEFIHVRGHSGNTLNEIVDHLAYNARANAVSRMTSANV